MAQMYIDRIPEVKKALTQLSTEKPLAEAAEAYVTAAGTPLPNNSWDRGEAWLNDMRNNLDAAIASRLSKAITDGGGPEGITKKIVDARQRGKGEAEAVLPAALVEAVRTIAPDKGVAALNHAVSTALTVKPEALAGAIKNDLNAIHDGLQRTLESAVVPQIRKKAEYTVAPQDMSEAMASIGGEKLNAAAGQYVLMATTKLPNGQFESANGQKDKLKNAVDDAVIARVEAEIKAKGGDAAALAIIKKAKLEGNNAMQALYGDDTIAAIRGLAPEKGMLGLEQATMARLTPRPGSNGRQGMSIGLNAIHDGAVEVLDKNSVAPLKERQRSSNDLPGGTQLALDADMGGTVTPFSGSGPAKAEKPNPVPVKGGSRQA